MSIEKQEKSDNYRRIPRKWYEDLIESIDHADSSSDLYCLLEETCNRLGITYITYGTTLPVSFKSQTIFVLSNKPADWQQDYESNDFIGADPRIIRARKQITPVIWRDIRPKNEQEKRVMETIARYGFCDGMTLSARNTRNEFGFLHLTFMQKGKKLSSRLAYLAPYMQLLMNYIHTAGYEIFLREHALGADEELRPLDVRLTDRERECLIWLAEGKTTWEIAQILKVKESTINNHLTQASNKLHTNNRAHTVAKAIAMKFVVPQYKKNLVMRYLRK